jgi:hypothetical protein
MKKRSVGIIIGEMYLQTHSRKEDKGCIIITRGMTEDFHIPCALSNAKLELAP